MSPYLAAHMARREQAWTPQRPDGYIPLCIAENALVWDLLRPRLEARRHVSPEVVRYGDFRGSPELRRAIAGLAGERILRRDVDPDHVLVANGAGTVLEVLFHNLCDPGDGVLVPTPSYAGFWADLQTRDQAVIVPVHTRSAEGFALTPSLLDEALSAADVPVKALLWTNPDNPTGRVASRGQVEAVVQWARSRGLHLVVDEIYALSVYGETPMTSVGEVVESFGDDVHWVWAFSKDFAMSGLRTGVLVTEHAELRQAASELAMWTAVPGDTQAWLADLVTGPWTERFLRASRQRLGAAAGAVTAALDEARIPYIAPQAGFFLLVDLRPCLSSPSWEAEHDLWQRIFEEADVNLTPGSACRVGEPGLFRLVFAGVPVEAAIEGVRRIGRLLS